MTREGMRRIFDFFFPKKKKKWRCPQVAPPLCWSLPQVVRHIRFCCTWTYSCTVDSISLVWTWCSCTVFFHESQCKVQICQLPPHSVSSMICHEPQFWHLSDHHLSLLDFNLKKKNLPPLITMHLGGPYELYHSQLVCTMLVGESSPYFIVRLLNYHMPLIEYAQ